MVFDFRRRQEEHSPALGLARIRVTETLSVCLPNLLYLSLTSGVWSGNIITYSRRLFIDHSSQSTESPIVLCLILIAHGGRSRDLAGAPEQVAPESWETSS